MVSIAAMHLVVMPLLCAYALRVCTNIQLTSHTTSRVIPEAYASTERTSTERPHIGCDACGLLIRETILDRKQHRVVRLLVERRRIKSAYYVRAVGSLCVYVTIALLFSPSTSSMPSLPLPSSPTHTPSQFNPAKKLHQHRRSRIASDRRGNNKLHAHRVLHCIYRVA